ncbi:MAG: hypothetical protein L0228_15295 [Planctomycetes bacterium]|nr:hypothetical protein [Planctomycetota bacterium]
MPSRACIYSSVVAIFAAATCIAKTSFCQPAVSSVSSANSGIERLVVHEWGTFTSFQDEQGDAIAGINGDDEPVPKFVHRISDFLLLGPQASIPVLSQGAPHCHPHVTMRLETPVVYFHPSPGMNLPLTVDVEVGFHSGWLSEYYPDAEVEAPGVKGQMSFGPIRRETVGSLRWKDVQVGTNTAGRETNAADWLAPRAVEAAGVTSANGESERFLFYRGVGRVESPLRVSRDVPENSLTLSVDFPAAWQDRRPPILVRKIWLVEVHDDKACAFRVIPGFEVPNGVEPRVVGTVRDKFDDSEFHVDNVAKLRASLRSVLIEDGLYADEADALLNTWKLSYFESPGLRLFYLVPRAWTDHVLPMRFSVETELVRTMVGRIEIVTPEQRQLLRQISGGPASDPEWRRNSLLSAASSQAEPNDFRAYRQLGRFRNALVLDELKRRPSKELQAFIRNYGLESYRLETSE